MKSFELNFIVKRDDSCNKEYLPSFNTIVFVNTEAKGNVLLCLCTKPRRCKATVQVQSSAPNGVHNYLQVQTAIHHKEIASFYLYMRFSLPQRQNGSDGGLKSPCFCRELKQWLSAVGRSVPILSYIVYVYETVFLS